MNFFQLEKLSFACTKIKEFSHENEDYEVRNSNAASFYAATTTATHLTTPQKFHEIRFLMCVAHLFNVVTGDLSNFFSKLGTTLEEGNKDGVVPNFATFFFRCLIKQGKKTFLL